MLLLALGAAVAAPHATLADDDNKSPLAQYEGKVWRVYFNQMNSSGAEDTARKLCLDDIDDNLCRQCEPDYYLTKDNTWEKYNPEISRYVCVNWIGDEDADNVVDSDGSWLAQSLTALTLNITRVMRLVVEIFTPSVERILDWAFRMPPELQGIWNKVLAFSNTVLVLAAMAVVVLNLLGIQMSNYAFKTFAPKFIFAAIGANLSWVIASLVLDIG
jgi:hypothetical protein